MERRQGRWGGEEGERLNPARIWTGGWFLSPSRCAEALEAILGISTKNKLIKREREEKSVTLPIYVSRCAGSAPAACSVTGKAVVSGIKGVCAGPSPSLLLVLQIRYSSAAETGGASHETIFLPLFFLFFSFYLRWHGRGGRASDQRRKRSWWTNLSLSLSLPRCLQLHRVNSDFPIVFSHSRRVRYEHAVTQCVAPRVMYSEQMAQGQILCYGTGNPNTQKTRCAMQWKV